MNLPEIVKIKGLQLDEEYIEIPEFKPAEKVDTSTFKLKVKIRKSKKLNKIFSHFLDWCKTKSD